MAKTIGWIIGIIILVGLGYWVYVYMSSNSTPSNPTDNASTQTEIKGNIVVSFTDATTDIQNVTDISMNVNKVELYSQTHGWVTVSADRLQYQLLQLHAKGQTKVYATAQIPADTYSSARITLAGVVVKTKNGLNKTAAVPNNSLTIQGNVVVQANKTASLKFDVLADKSTHVTAKGDYVFAPVIEVESRSNASVNTSNDGIVIINGGSIDTNSTVGMDVDGSLKTNFQLNANVKLDIDASGVINVIGATGGILKTNGAGNATTSSGTINGTLNGVINY